MSQGDIAVLGVRVESGEVVTAADNLEKLVEAGQQAEKAAAAIGVQAKTSGVSIKEFATSSKSAEQALGSYARQAEAAGMSVKEYTHALRGVPAQLTDIVVSLQGGMNPFTVLLQQGGQLKDMFGGVGAATRALGGYVVGLANPFTIAGAAAVALGVAYYKGSQESDEFRKSLILTGNAAGTNAGAMSDLASQIGATVGTTGAAAEVLASLASSGEIAGDSFGSVATAALEMRDSTGRAVEETVAEFVKIGKDPVAAAKELNERYNFLTASTYAQIAALKEQGDTVGAAKLLTDAYAQTIDTRSKEIVENLGWIEKAWRGVWGAAKGAGDAALNFGRSEGFSEQLAKAQKDLADIDKIFAGNPIAAAGKENQERREILVSTIQALQDQIRLQKSADQAQENYNLRQRESIQSQSILNSQLQATDSNQKKLASRLEEINELARKSANGDGGRVYTEAELNQLREAAKAQFKDQKGPVGAPGIDLSTFNEAESALKSLVSNYQNSMRVLDASLKAGVITQQDYAQQKSALIDKERTDVEEGYKSQITALQALADKSSTTGAQRIQIDQRIADTRQKMTQALQKLDADQQVLSLQSQERLAKETAAIEAYGQALEDNLKRTQDSLDLQLAGFGLGERARQQLQEMLKIRQDYEKDLEKLERDHRLKRLSDNEYAGQKVELEKWLAQRLQLQEQYYKEEDALRGDWQNGVSRAYNSYIEETKDIAGQTENLFSDALYGIEDAFVDLAVEGKLSFKDLTDSIIADLARMATKAYLTVPLLSALGLGGSTPGGSGSILGGSGGGGGGLGLFDMASKAYGVATSGFGSAVSAGWSAGEGFLGGMQNAISGGYNYISKGLSGMFSGGAQGGAGVMLDGAGNVVNMNPGTSAMGGAMAGIGGALYGYGQSGLKGAATGAAGGVGGYYAGAAIGSLAGPIGTVIGGLIGSALGGMLGGSVFGGDWVTKDQGISLAVDDGDLLGRQYEYQKKKGGLFGSNKKRTRYKALSPEMEEALGATYDATGDSVLDLFDRLNVELNDGVLDGLTIGAKKISTKDKTAEEIQAEIAKWFGGVADSMVSAVDAATAAGLGGYTFEGLTAFVQNLEGVNDVIRYLNKDMFETSVAGGKLAEQLTAIAGGFDVLKANGATYYQAFIGESERMDDTLDAVTRAFAAANQELPKSRAGFRDIVESIDTTTQAGMQMFATLMALSGQASTYYDILEQRTSNGVNAAFAAVQRAVAAQQKAINKSLTDANSRISELTGISNALDNALKQLRGTGDDAVRMLRSQAQATLTSALAIARAGGSLSGFAGLTDALDVLGSNNTDLYGSLEEFNRDQGRTANQVAELNKLNGKQLSAAEKNAQAMQSQLDALDAQLEFAQQQIDAINGVDSSVKSVAEAVRAMNAAIVASLAMQAKGAAQANTPQNNRSIVDTIYQSVLGRGTAGDEAGAAFWANALQSGKATYQDIAASIAKGAAGNSAESAATKKAAEDYLRSIGVPGYAAGGLISGPGTGTSDSIIARLSNGEYVMSAEAVRMFGTGLLDQMNAGRLPAFAQGGPVLDIPSPVQAFGASRSAQQSGAGNAAAAAEIKALKDEVQSLTRQIIPLLKQTADHTAQLAESGTQIVGTVDTRVVSV